ARLPRRRALRAGLPRDARPHRQRGRPRAPTDRALTTTPSRTPCPRPPVYSAAAALGGELAVPCTRDPLHAGLNPRRRPARSEAASARGVEGRVLRDVGPRTGSGRERSSPKRFPAGAVGSPGWSLPCGVAIESFGVDGGCTALHHRWGGRSG